MNPPYKILEDVSKEKFLGSFSNSITSTYLDILLKMMETQKTLEKLLLVHAGYAVDLAAGFITREHDDLDLATLVANIPTYKALFSKAHFEVKDHPNMDPNLSFYSQTYIQDIQKSICIDVVSFDVSGDKVFDREMLGGEKYFFPIKASELIWERKIGEISVQFFSPYLLYKFKKMQLNRDTISEKDIDDIEILERAYPELVDNILI